jgi:hypothetical protein
VIWSKSSITFKSYGTSRSIFSLLFFPSEKDNVMSASILRNWSSTPNWCPCQGQWPC